MNTFFFLSKIQINTTDEKIQPIKYIHTFLYDNLKISLYLTIFKPLFIYFYLFYI
jgi:hypothetical protein